MNKFYVYEHLRKDNKLVFYVGKGKGNRAYRFERRNTYWKRIYKKYGCIVNIVHDGLSEKEALDKEVELIKKYKLQNIKLTNLTEGGEGLSGFKPTLKTRQKRSQALLGHSVSIETREKLKRKHSGKKCKPETLEKLRVIAANKKGKKLPSWWVKNQRIGWLRKRELYGPIIRSKETREKISKANKIWHKNNHNSFFGKKHTEETKQLLSLLKKGKKFSEKAKRNMSNDVIDLRSGFIYTCNDLTEKYKVKWTTMFYRIKYSKKWPYKFVNDY